MGLIDVRFAPENGHCRSHRSSSAWCQQRSYIKAQPYRVLDSPM